MNRQSFCGKGFLAASPTARPTPATVRHGISDFHPGTRDWIRFPRRRSEKMDAVKPVI
jgi:hypothetical protein